MKAKKIIGFSVFVALLLLVALAIVPITSNVAHADSIIDKVDLTLYTYDTQGLKVATTPKAGNKLADFGLTTKNNDNDYYVSGYHWLDKTADEEYVSPGDATFIGGHTYELRANIQINNVGNAEMKYFSTYDDNPTATTKINDSESGVETIKNPGRDAKTFFWMIYEFTVSVEEVDTIKIINVVEPVGGSSPDYDFIITTGNAHKSELGVQAEGKYTGSEWLDVGANSGMADKKFEAFKQYKFTMYITLDEGYKFKAADQVDVFVNGEQVDSRDYSFNGNKTATTIEMTYVCKDEPHKVTFNAGNNGKGSPQVVTVMGEYVLPTPESLGFEPASDVYEFYYWNVPGAATTYKPGNKIKVTKDVTINAEWKPIYHTVTFEKGTKGDGTMQSMKVTHRKAIELPECLFVSTEETYEFGGWAYTEGGAKIESVFITINDDVTLYALWTEMMTYTITFEGNGGDGDTQYEYIQAKEYTLPDNTMFDAPDGQHFAGWHPDGATKEPYPAGTKVALTGNVIYSAIWTDNEASSITYDDGNGTLYTYAAPQGSSIKVKSFGQVKSCLTDVTGFIAPVGKRFVCWQNWDEDGRPDVEVDTDYVVPNDSTLFRAKYEDTDETVYTVTIDSNGGEGDQITFKAVEGAGYTLPVCTYTAPTGYLFKAWEILSVEYQPGIEIEITDNTNIGAKWYKPVGITADFLVENVLVGEKLDTTYLYVAVEYDDNTFEEIDYHEVTFYEGYFGELDDLVGQPECDIADFTFNDKGRHTFTVSDGEFLASFNVFAKLQYPVTFDSNGGNGAMEDEYVWDGDDYVVPYCAFEAPANKVFKCWDMGKVDEVLYVYPGMRLEDVDADIELKAVWGDPFAAKIIFNANGGSGEMDPQDIDSFIYVLPACTFGAPENMKFRAWLYNGTEYAALSEIYVDEDATIKAVWELEEQEVVEEFMEYEENDKIYYAFDFVKTTDLDLSEIAAAAAAKDRGVRISVNGELYVVFDEKATKKLTEIVGGMSSGISVEITDSKVGVQGSIKCVWITMVGQTNFGEGKVTVLFNYDVSKVGEGESVKVIRTDALGVKEADMECDVWSGNVMFTANSLPADRYYVLVVGEEENPGEEPGQGEPNDPEPNDPEPNDPEPNDPEPNDPEPNDPEQTEPKGKDDVTVAPSDKKLSGGAIAGIVIGCVVVVAGGVVLALFLLRKKGLKGRKIDGPSTSIEVPEKVEEPVAEPVGETAEELVAEDEKPADEE